jgi:proline racemase
MAVLDAMGLLADIGRFVHEGIAGTVLDARLVTRTRVGALDAIVPEISGRAWMTGEHTFVSDPSDPLAEGFRIS